MREPQRMRRLTAYLCLSLLGGCLGPGLEPPERVAQNSAGSPGMAAAADAPGRTGAGATGAMPPVTAPTTPMQGTADSAARDAGRPNREEDAGTDDSGIEP
jgi:hypothetical protein